MRIRVLHETAFRFERPIKALVQILRLTPRDDGSQHVLRWHIEPSIDGRLKPREDAFGNIVHVLSADHPVDEVTIRVTGEVETHETHGLVENAVERLPDLFYLRETALTATDAALCAFAHDATAHAASDPLGAMHALLGAIHRGIPLSEAADVGGRPAAEVLARGRGTSRDLAHVFVAAARHLAVPARLVSGYLYRADDPAEQEAAHAWAEAKIPGLGWIGFDPASGFCAGDAHLRLAAGLDGLDAAPIRSMGPGGGAPSVRLRVESARRQVQS